VINLYANLVALLAVTSDRLKREEKGATAVEYGLMVGLIAAVIIATVVILGGQLNVLFEKITGALTKAG
jgi:pilus assembly protein Flp/PilA